MQAAYLSDCEQVGDLLHSCNGNPIESVEALCAALRGQAGSLLTLRYSRPPAPQQCALIFERLLDCDGKTILRCVLHGMKHPGKIQKSVHSAWQASIRPRQDQLCEWTAEQAHKLYSLKNALTNIECLPEESSRKNGEQAFDNTHSSDGTEEGSRHPEAAPNVQSNTHHNLYCGSFVERDGASQLSKASVMKSRAEDLDSTLDQTTKAGNAVCVTNAELRGELATLRASYRVLVQEAEEHEQELVRGRSALAEVEKELTWAQTRVRELEQRLEKAAKEGAALEASNYELQATVASMREQGGYDKTRITFMEDMIAAGDSSKALTEEVKQLEAARQVERDTREACEREMATLRRDLENMTHMKNDLERRLETAQVEAGMMKGRAENFDRTLDETTKADNAAFVKNTELKCQQLMVRRIRNRVTAKVIETWRMNHAEAKHLRHLTTRAVIMSRIRALVVVMIQWREHTLLSQMAVKARCRYMKRMLLKAWECWYKYCESKRQAMVQLADQIKANAGMKRLSKMLRCIALKKWLNKSLCKTWQRWLNVLLERKILFCTWSAVLRRKKQRVSTGPSF